MRSPFVLGLLCLGFATVASAQKAPPRDYPIQPVAFTHVHVHDKFWAPKMQTNTDVTIPHTL